MSYNWIEFLYSYTACHCQYDTCTRLEQERYWIFQAGEPTVSWRPNDAGSVNLSTNFSNLTTAYPFTFTLGALGKNLTLYDLKVNQSGRYWCVSYNFDIQNAASWDLGVCQLVPAIRSPPLPYYSTIMYRFALPPEMMCCLWWPSLTLKMGLG